MTPPFSYLDYDTRAVGVDETNGRFGEVSVETCKVCGTEWLHYFVEYPSFSKSGRWFRGPVTPEMTGSLTPETALTILASLPWHFSGGSYFGTTGTKVTGPGSIETL